MTVIRVSHQKNYVVINKLVLEDKDLSFKAKGIWAYYMSRPDDWTFHVSHLATISSEKEKAVYSGLKELEKAGYLRKIQLRENGRFGTFDYEISEIKIISPQPQKGDTVKSSEKNAPTGTFPPLACFTHADNEALLSIDQLRSKEINQSREEIDRLSSKDEEEGLRDIIAPLKFTNGNGKKISLSKKHLDIIIPSTSREGFNRILKCMTEKEVPNQIAYILRCFGLL